MRGVSNARTRTPAQTSSRVSRRTPHAWRPPTPSAHRGPPSPGSTTPASVTDIQTTHTCSSCTLCRTRKIRCNRESPCSNCVRAGNKPCIFEGIPPLATRPGHRPPPTGRFRLSGFEPPAEVSSDKTSSRTSDTGPSTPATTTSNSQLSAKEIEFLRRRIGPLEQEVAGCAAWAWDDRHGLPLHTPALPPTRPNITLEIADSSLGGTFHVQQESRLCGPTSVISNSVVHKTRLFGQSHWINGVALVYRLVFVVLYDPDGGD